jgi:hypothetical protein
MLCNEFMHELAVPTDDRDSAALAEHLANCSACAAWTKRDAQFDRLWNATRPLEPSPQVWDGVWGHIASSLDSSTPAESEVLASPMATLNGSVSHVERQLGLTPASSRSRRWNWAAIGLISLAQAAAVLLAVGWAWRDSPKSQGPQEAMVPHSPALSPDSSTVVSTVVKETGLLSVSAVEIEPGPLVVIRMEDSTVKVVDLTPDGISYSVDDWFLVFNAVEDIAKPVVAMKE